ncbi:hypothetical protein LINPERPRIM_LOCUS26473 [Linum perenne]
MPPRRAIWVGKRGDEARTGSVIVPMNQEAFIIINNHNPIGKRRRKRSGLRFVSGFPAQASSSLAPPVRITRP